MIKLRTALTLAKALLEGVKFKQDQLVDGSIIQFETDTIENGETIYLVDGAGDFAQLPDGAYLTKTHVNFTITDGQVSDVTGKSTEQTQNGPVKQAQAATGPEDTLDNDNPGKNDGKPTKVPKDSSKGKGAIDLDEELKNKKPYGDVEYADPKNGKYPIDTEEHIRAAWNYINKGNAEGDVPAIKAKIIAAWKKKIDPAGPPSAQKHEINAPGAGAPPNLINPDEIAADSDYSTCMSKLNELHTQHGFLQSSHDKLRQEHDAVSSKLNELIPKYNQLATDHHKLKMNVADMSKAKLKMAAEIAVISKRPAGQAIEEVKQMKQVVDPDIANSKVYKVLNS
jgi:hypothetical protein